MTGCVEISAALHSYVDGELAPAEGFAVEAHLLDCAACRERYESLTHIVGSVRAAYPLYAAPQGSYGEVRQRIRLHRRRYLLRAAAAAAVGFGAAAVAWFGLVPYSHAQSPLAAFAARAHTQRLHGSLKLDIQSDSPRAVETWLHARLPFDVALREPAAMPAAGYRLVGARLMRFHREEAAYVAYEVGGQPVSLMVVAAPAGTPHSGTAKQIGRLTFYSTSHEGLTAISWTDLGVNYSLVSGEGHGGAEACAVCHGTASERRKFAPLVN